MSIHGEARPSSVVVATAQTQAAAELIRATLAAHGFEATITPSFPAYPAIDFVQGLLVSVDPEVERAARDLLDSA